MNTQLQRRQWQQIRLAIGAAAVMVVAGIGYLSLSSLENRGEGSDAADSAASIVGVQSFADLDRRHVEGPVTYPQTPPVGGPHAAAWQNCGFYTAPVAEETGVHSLEHGAVWITYRSDLTQDQFPKLRELGEAEPYVLVSPVADLPAPVIASAWGKQLTLASVVDTRLDDFVHLYQQGAQTPELGAPCSGGLAEATG